TARVSQRLAAEATVLAPGPLSSHLPGRTPAQRFTYAVAAAAAAIALVSWLAFGPQPEVPHAPQIAQGPTAPVTVQLTSSANDYLLAHQGFSPRVSLQGMVPYVRTVAARPDESNK